MARRNRPLIKKKEVKYGPYARQRADGGWEMNEEGQAFLVAWMEEWPVPALLFQKAYKWAYFAWTSANWKDGKRRGTLDLLNQTCLVACCKAILKYDPSVCKFTTYAANAMFFEVRRELWDMDKAKRKGVRVISGTADQSDDGMSMFDEVASAKEAWDASDSEEELARLIDVAVTGPEEYRPTHCEERWRYVFNEHFAEGKSQVQIARELKVTRSCITQIVERGCNKIRKAIAEGQLCGVHS